MTFRTPNDDGWEDLGHKQFVQGGVGLDDFEETIKHVKKAVPKKPVKKKGCPGNDFNAHVYVWVPETEVTPWTQDDLFFEFYGFHKYEYKVCAGCLKRTKYRVSEEYTKKFKRQGKYVYEEYRDPEYNEFRGRRWRTWAEVKASLGR